MPLAVTSAARVMSTVQLEPFVPMGSESCGELNNRLRNERRNTVSVTASFHYCRADRCVANQRGRAYEVKPAELEGAH